jgi:hypothetical protein
MAQRRLLFHTACLTYKVTVGSVAAENVGSGRALRRIHRTMMRSAGHRATSSARSTRSASVS